MNPEWGNVAPDKYQIQLIVRACLEPKCYGAASTQNSLLAWIDENLIFRPKKHDCPTLQADTTSGGGPSLGTLQIQIGQNTMKKTVQMRKQTRNGHGLDLL